MVEHPLTMLVTPAPMKSRSQGLSTLKWTAILYFSLRLPALFHSVIHPCSTKQRKRVHRDHFHNRNIFTAYKYGCQINPANSFLTFHKRYCRNLLWSVHHSQS